MTTTGPLPSPHPIFGKKPGWWTRRFGMPWEKYWPTYEDVRAFQYHMERLKAEKAERRASTDRRRPLLPFDPTLSTSDPRMQVWGVKNHLESEQRRAAEPGPWWKEQV